MGSIISKWIFPGIVTVVIGTIAALYFTQANIEADLTQRSSSAIGATGIEEAEISFSGRDGKITGISTNPRALEGLVAQLSALPGVRSIVSEIIIAPTAEPYSFKAVKNEDGTLSLSGAVPSYAVRDAILERTGGVDAGLELMAGVPDGDWVARTSFAASRLQGMRTGEASLSNLSLSVSGQAGDVDAYSATITELGGSLPNDLVLAAADIKPAIVENYLFSFEQDEGQAILSGFAPDEAALAAILAQAGDNVTNNLKIAAGAPEQFAENALAAISAARELEKGSAGFMQNGWFLKGQPATIAAGATAQGALMAAGTNANDWNIALDPAPNAIPYSWSADKFDNGKIVVSGNVPDEATRAAIMTQAGEGATDNMSLANGAPQGFAENALAGISAVQSLVTGRAGHSTDGWFLSGQPANMAAGMAAKDTANAAGWNVALAPAPDVVPYIWSASKTDDGTIIVSGNVPDETTRAAIMAGAGEGAVDNMKLANGAPENFAEDALAGISAIKELVSARAGFGGGGWYFAGQPADMDAIASARTTLAAGTQVDNWNISIAPAPDVIPFTWYTSKDADGTLSVNGNVPDEATRNALMASAGEGAVDNMKLANGAPENFRENALVAVSAAKLLSEGRAGHGGSGWYLFGATISNDARDAAIDSLNGAPTNANDWYVSIPEHEEIVVPEEEVQEEPQETAAASPPQNAPEINFEVLRFQEQPMMLSGMVPSNKSRTYLGLIAGGVLTGDLVVSPRGAPDNFMDNARSGIRGLHRLMEGRLAYEDNIWTLTGIAPDAQSRTDALAQIAGLEDRADWQTDIILPTALGTCQVRVSDWAAQSSIEFETGSTQISDESLKKLRDLADYLAQCPDSAVRVEGHTDNQGDFVSNLKLSSARADAVVDALTELGIDDERFYAIGYGETSPIETNDTPQGRQANRRIVFSVLEL